MKIVHRGDTLNITEVDELSARNCERFRSELEPLLPSSKRIRIDLSQTDFIDCRGVSTLLALLRLGCGGPFTRSVTVLNPNRCVRRIIGLTGLDRIVPVDEPSREQAPQPKTALSAIAVALGAGQMRLTVTVSEPAALPTAGQAAALSQRFTAAAETAVVVPANSPPGSV